ncbi:hypothetical protein OTB20_25485 [Streptomyces sp. H27-H1]|uniref:DUF7919 family protein n=1 Tax=unclassified Streptomyces TaxID=2593676 RepID=UPI00226DAB67|nr:MULTISPECIES: hypothetical protein [unclassified Streptomyces]MCY0929493.1 hypothetical protein [Streptomyces sp. H27-H1]MCY0938838.1 hypothetical protein [Streptomyces sp. H34-S4]
MEYSDLSPYSYSAAIIPMINVGWLGLNLGIQDVGYAEIGRHETEFPVPTSKFLSKLTLGEHVCEFCPRGGPQFTSNGEYHYYCPSGISYSTPAMISHYVESHGYRPPPSFLSAITSPAILRWDGRAEILKSTLSDTAADFELRIDAITDIAYWNDRRALSALISATTDDDLLDIAGFQIGASLHRILSRTPEGTNEFLIESLPTDVQLGFMNA